MSIAPANERFVSSYTDLAREVRDAGLLRRNYLYYWTEMSVAVAAFAAQSRACAGHVRERDTACR